MSFDIELLEKGGEDFNKLVALVPEILNNETIKPFYQAMMKLLTSEQSEEDTLHRALIAICKAASQMEYIDELLSEEILLKLPYNNDCLKEQIFDLLYIVAQNAPEGITLEVCNLFSPYIKIYTRKSLVVFTAYAKSYANNKYKKKVAVLDLLLSQNTASSFRTGLYIKDYVSLIAFLCQKHSNYRSQRLPQCWDAVCDCLNLAKRDSTLCACYYSLCQLYEQSPATISNCPFPSHAVSCHIRRPKVQKAAISLLLRTTPSGDATDVINSLVWAAHTEINASLILVKMASDLAVAQALIRDATWMVQDLPTKVDTMRIFAVVLSHQKLRVELSEKNEALTFLKGIIELDTPGILSVVTTFIRRFPLTPSYVQHCSDFGLLSSFLAVATGHDDEKTIKTALLFVDTFAKIGYAREYIDVCDYVANLVTKDGGEGPMALSASKVAVDLARYPKCAIRFQKIKLDVFFYKNQKNPKVKKAAVRFLRSMKKAYQEELAASGSPRKSAQSSPVATRQARQLLESGTPKKIDSSSSSSDEDKKKKENNKKQNISKSSSSDNENQNKNGIDNVNVNDNGNDNNNDNVNDNNNDKNNDNNNDDNNDDRNDNDNMNEDNQNEIEEEEEEDYEQQQPQAQKKSFDSNDSGDETDSENNGSNSYDENNSKDIQDNFEEEESSSSTSPPSSPRSHPSGRSPRGPRPRSKE